VFWMQPPGVSAPNPQALVGARATTNASTATTVSARRASRQDGPK
jgi:hypothetical protein